MCPKCKRNIAAGERHKATTPAPTARTLMRWDMDGIAKATDGCRVEPDGKCPHGHRSWLLVAGFI